MYPPPPLPFVQALLCPSTRARLTIIFLTAPLGFLLTALSKHGTPSDRRFPDFQRACARGDCIPLYPKLQKCGSHVHPNFQALVSHVYPTFFLHL